MLHRLCIIIYVMLLSGTARLYAGDMSEYEIAAMGNTTTAFFRDNHINTVYKDSRGFVWVGTGSTVERIDGYGTLVYTMGQKEGVTPSPFLVNAIMEVGKDTFWIGTEQGLWRLNHKTGEAERCFPDEINFPVLALAGGEGERLTIGTANGLYMMSGGRVRRVSLNKKSQDEGNTVLDIYVESRHEVWTLTPNGLQLCDPESGAAKTYMAAAGDKFRCMAASGGCIFIGTGKGAVHRFGIKGRRPEASYDGNRFAVQDIAAGNGMVAVATHGGGLYMLDMECRRLLYTAVFNPSDPKAGLLSNNISSVLISDGNVWCGTEFYLGLNILRKRSSMISLYQRGRYDLGEMVVRSSINTGDHTLIGTREGFYSVDNRTGDTRYVDSRSEKSGMLRSNIIFSMHRLGKEILIGTCNGGVALYDPAKGTFRANRLTETLTSNDIFCIIDDGDRIWLAASDGLYRYGRHDGTVKEYNVANAGIPGSLVFGVMKDSKGRLWLATDKGVAIFDRNTGRCTRKGVPAAVRGIPMRTVYEGRDGTMFFCTMENRLYVADKDMKSVGTPLPVAVHNIVQDRLGNYWMGNYDGVMRIDERLERATLCTPTDGLPQVSVTPGSPMRRDEDGIVWMCTSKGLYRIDPDVRLKPSPVRLTEITVNGSKAADDYGWRAAGGVLRLGSDENNVSFFFTSLGYEGLNAGAFEYMLEGKDTAWIQKRDTESISYYGLKPGKYRFKIRKTMNDGTLDSVGIEIEAGSGWAAYTAGIICLLALCLIAVYMKKRKKAGADDVKGGEGTATADEGAGERQADEAQSGTAAAYVKLTEAEAAAIIDRLNAYMETHEAYLDTELKQSDVASALHMSTYVLSAVFTHYIKMGYYDYINRYRVEKFKKSVEDGLHTRYTLVTLAEKCGFKSKASFYRAFKKFTGMTPNDYVTGKGGQER